MTIKSVWVTPEAEALLNRHYPLINPTHGQGTKNATGAANLGGSGVDAAACGGADQPLDAKTRIIYGGYNGFPTPVILSEGYFGAAREALTILDERITAKLTPALNDGTAMDALILTATAIRELRAELSEFSKS